MHTVGVIRDESALAQCYSAADVYVGPSLAETFGLVYIEAMACGTPVIAFDCTAVPEVVHHLETGYLAKTKDIDDLVHGLRWLLRDDRLREKLGRQGRELVERDYTLERQAQRYIELYEEVIANRASGQTTRAKSFDGKMIYAEVRE
jgi:glycosyltransferase involved in cell wall biosynthesis